MGWSNIFSSYAVVLCQFLVLAGNAGTRSTLFSGGLIWDRAGNSFWYYVHPSIEEKIKLSSVGVGVLHVYGIPT